MKILSLIITSICFVTVFAQNPTEDAIKTKNFPKLRKIINSVIPGVPVLSQPVLITGTKQEMRTEKHGLIYPALYDWNKDGKKDMLLGEFETGDVGSYIKVYLNEGSDQKPKYSGEYFYATDVNGDTITNHQWCCIGIHPRMEDMDGDGHLDILSGQYNPGLISWWRGSEKGFLPRVFIDQEGYIKDVRLTHDDAPWDPKSFLYWNYSSADFADFNGDGLLDLFVGGSDGFRIALNIGTNGNPKFGLRKYLHHVNGDILYVKKPSQEEINEHRKQGRYINFAGVGKAYMTPIDWDNDGVLDLLVTYGYYKTYHKPIEFFRGVETDKGLRFEKAKPLFTEINGKKALPGCQPMITVTDYNNDGIKDIVFGISIPTVNGFEADEKIAWSWIDHLKINMPGKDAGRSLKWYGGLDSAIIKIKAKPFLKEYMLGNLDDYKYLTIQHRGYVFVMYGRKNSKKAIAKKTKAEPEMENKLIANELIKNSKIDGPVSFSAKAPERVKFNKEYTVEVTLKFQKGWYVYSENEANVKAGFIPTVVSFEFPEGIEMLGEPVLPKETPKGALMTYKGEKITFTQKFKYPYPKSRDIKLLKEINIKAKIKFQTCNNDMCLPPEEHVVDLKAAVRSM